MRKLLMTAALLLAPGLAAQASEHETRELRAFMDEGRRVATRILDQIRSELVTELERTGPLRAITVCKYSAPEVTSRLSRQHGVRITRVSLRPRNRAIGEADAWEQNVLLAFEKRAAAGEKVEGLEHAEIVDEPAGHFFRYMRAIPVGAPCLACHGPNVSEGVKAQLASEYPHDNATGYQVGQVRGAVSVKKPL